MQTTLDQATITENTENGFWTGPLSTGRLDDSVARSPQGVANLDSRREVTWAKLTKLTDPAAPALLELGVESGCEISIQLRSWGQGGNSTAALSGKHTPEDKIADRDSYLLPSTQVRIAGQNNARPPIEPEGRMQEDDPFLPLGYVEHLNNTRRLYHGAWFDTRDNGALDNAEHPSIARRTKDISAYRSEDPYSVVISAEDLRDLTIDSLHDSLRANGIAKSHWPEFLVLVVALPRTASGKIQKFGVRQLLDTETLQMAGNSSAQVGTEHD